MDTLCFNEWYNNMTRQQNRSKIIRNSVWLFGLHEVVFDRDTCIYAFEKVRKERHAEPHTVHWGMKIDFLLSLSFFFSTWARNDILFLFLFLPYFLLNVCVRHVDETEQKKFIYHQVFFACRLMKKERKKENEGK